MSREFLRRRVHSFRIGESAVCRCVAVAAKLSPRHHAVKCSARSFEILRSTPLEYRAVCQNSHASARDVSVRYRRLKPPRHARFWYISAIAGTTVLDVGMSAPRLFAQQSRHASYDVTAGRISHRQRETDNKSLDTTAYQGCFTSNIFCRICLALWHFAGI